MNKKLTKEWIVKDGSIYVKQSLEEIKDNAMLESVAFNVGNETAKYICDIHNKLHFLRSVRPPEVAYQRARFA